MSGTLPYGYSYAWFFLALAGLMLAAVCGCVAIAVYWSRCCQGGFGYGYGGYGYDGYAPGWGYGHPYGSAPPVVVVAASAGQPPTRAQDEASFSEAQAHLRR